MNHEPSASDRILPEAGRPERNDPPLEQENRTLREMASSYALTAMLSMEDGAMTDAIAADLARIWGRAFQNAVFFLVLVQFDAPETAFPAQREALKAAMRRHLDIEMPIVFPGENCQLALVLLPDFAPREVPVEPLYAVADELSAAGCPAVLYVSVLQDSPGLLRKLYRDVCVLRDFGQEPGPVVFQPSEHEEYHPSDTIQQAELELYRLMEKRKFFETVTVLDDLIVEIAGQGQMSLAQLRSEIHFRILQLRRVAKLDLWQYSDPFSRAMQQMDHAETLRQLQEAVYDAFAAMEDETLQDQAGAGSIRVNNIRQFIRSSYQKPDLGAAMICQEFRLSPTWLSRIFKAETGHGIVEEIHTCRIDAAKDLLATTDLCLDDIARQVGFSSRGVLIRIFKSREGITPGVYRARRQS